MSMRGNLSGQSDRLATVRVVVGAAIVRAGRVLAAQRSAPAALAGGWEFPGGKVEPGETPAAALARECREELGVTVEPQRELGTAVDGGIELRLWLARLAAEAPVASTDHDELRWLESAQLDSVDWLPVDRKLLGAIRAALG